MPTEPITVTSLRGPLLNPQSDGSVDYLADATLVADSGSIVSVGPTSNMPMAFRALPTRATANLILPPFLDLHTHLPQYPIRGHFVDGIDDDPPEGRLLAGLNRNVLPEEARHADPDYAARVFHAFQVDALSHGVVGGLAFGSVHAAAARVALTALRDLWSVGLVLMNSNCPEYLRTDEAGLTADFEALAIEFGLRFLPADRFAVCVTTPLRRRAVELARAHGLRLQTHLNEQRSEKAFVERTLYPGYASYTDVYRRDGLLDRRAIVAHCIQMSRPEWGMLADSGAAVAHCPTSNTLLGSGVMPLDDMPPSVSYAISTDVGASPTCSLLAEMAQFLKVHAGRSSRATPEEALFRTTLAPAQILGLDSRLGTFAVGMPLSYIEAALPAGMPTPGTATEAILALLGQPLAADATIASGMARLADGAPSHSDLGVLSADVARTAARLETRVARVVLGGETVFERVS